MTIYFAPAGAGPAPCAVCAKPTMLRRPIGDGLAPMCSDACDRSWSDVLKKEADELRSRTTQKRSDGQ